MSNDTREAAVALASECLAVYASTEAYVEVRDGVADEFFRHAEEVERLRGETASVYEALQVTRDRLAACERERDALKVEAGQHPADCKPLACGKCRRDEVIRKLEDRLFACEKERDEARVVAGAISTLSRATDDRLPRCRCSNRGGSSAGCISPTSPCDCACHPAATPVHDLCGATCMYCRGPYGTCALPEGHPDFCYGDKAGKVCTCSHHLCHPAESPVTKETP